MLYPWVFTLFTSKSIYHWLFIILPN